MSDRAKRKSDEMVAEVERIVRAWFEDYDDNADANAIAKVRDVLYPGKVPKRPQYQDVSGN